MPSPIAHTSIAMALWPATARKLRGTPARGRIIILGATLVTLVAADFDILTGSIFGSGPFVDHGGPTHSFVAAAIWAMAFATVLSIATRAMHWTTFWMLGFIAYGSHIMLDAFTFGRGVRMFWPFLADRIASPLPIFAGVRHSTPASIVDHTLTIATELLFALLVWRVTAWWYQRGYYDSQEQPSASDKEQSVVS